MAGRQLLSNNDISFFKKNGYLLVKDVFSQSDIFQLRKIFDDAKQTGTWNTSPYYTDTIMTDIYNFYPEIIDIIFSEKHIQVAKDLLGTDCILIPECAVHRNRYFDWHRDDINELGRDFSVNKDLSVIQTCIYFQDNNSETGGGMTVCPGSHLKKNSQNILYFKLKKMLNAFHKENVPSQTGDLLVFDYSLIHRGTPCKTKDGNKQTKYAIFNKFSKNNSSAKEIAKKLRIADSDYYKNFLVQDTLNPAFSKIKELSHIDIYY